tara:strand:+ start:1354 stop:1932 length:579 start_codon:yes stop_codon:yes gene_type:complete
MRYDLDKIKKDFNTFNTLAKNNFSKKNYDAFNNLINDFGEKLIMAPASQRNDLHLSRPGGLLRHSLNTMKVYSHLFIRSTSVSDLRPPVTTCLLHDIGKLGTLEEDYYVIAEGHYKNNYFINDKLRSLRVPQRTLKILSDYKFDLTDEEYCAITNSYFFIEEKDYWQSVWNIPELAVNLSIAKLLAIRKEKT